jgi:hypothetical protein
MKKQMIEKLKEIIIKKIKTQKKILELNTKALKATINSNEVDLNEKFSKFRKLEILENTIINKIKNYEEILNIINALIKKETKMKKNLKIKKEKEKEKDMSKKELSIEEIDIEKEENELKLKNIRKVIEGNYDQVSDGYHTFDELYYHRMILFSVICKKFLLNSWKSKLHEDGTMFSDYFIAGVNTKEGQFTYHYHLKYWDEFEGVKELEKAPEWDGHSPASIKRLFSLL